jgi:hypothetical protein
MDFVKWLIDLICVLGALTNTTEVVETQGCRNMLAYLPIGECKIVCMTTLKLNEWILLSG